VVDPGVLIAGFISTGGTTARLLDAILERRAIAIISPRLIRELHTVLLRDKFRQYASVEDVDAFVVRLLARSDLVDDPTHLPPVTRDPDDDYLVALAGTQQNTALVSGDQVLLTVDLPGVQVLSPRMFLDALTGAV
jgi:uncharacterized protein